MQSPAAQPPTGINASSSREGAWQTIGAHRIRVIDDCIEWILDGPLSLAELQAIEMSQMVVNEKYGYWLSLVDCHKAGGMGPDVRRYIAEQSRLRPGLVNLSALYGCSAMVVALTTLISRATALFSGKPQSVEICRDEASARACLAVFRKTHPGVPRAKRPTTH